MVRICVSQGGKPDTGKLHSLYRYECMWLCLCVVDGVCVCVCVCHGGRLSIVVVFVKIMKLLWKS